MLVKKMNFKVVPIEQNEDGIMVQQGVESILNEYRTNGYCDKAYDGYSDNDIVDRKLYVTEYQGQEFRGYIEECYYQERKTYKVFMKDCKGECFHIGYVPFNRVNEVEEWLDNNKLEIKGNVFVIGGHAKYCTQTDNELKTEDKPYSFEVELRFYDNKEDNKKIKENNNKFINRKNLFIIGIILLVLLVIVLFFAVTKVKFEIANFTIDSETTDFEYTDNTTSYEGTGLIITQEKKGTYLVALKIKLKSGGDEDSIKEYDTIVMVNDGKGEFNTYEAGQQGKISKPEYEFEILGYMKFK